MVQVQSSWFPLVDRNPQQFLNIPECSDADFKKATIKIYHDANLIHRPLYCPFWVDNLRVFVKIYICPPRWVVLNL